jgi:O-antigen ligase
LVQSARAYGGAIGAYAVVLLVFAAHLLYGANRTDLALAFAAIWFACLAAVMLAWPVRDADAYRALLWPATAFSATLALVGLSLTPAALGGANALWLWVQGAPGVASIDPYGAVVEMVKLLALGSIFLVGFVFGVDGDGAKLLLRAVVTVGLAFSGWAFLDHAMNPAMLFGLPRPVEPGRLSAAFGSANTAATLFGSLTLLNLVDLIGAFDAGRPPAGVQGRDTRQLALHLVRPSAGLMLAFVCLALTQSRAGLAATVGLALCLLAAVLYVRQRHRAVAAAPIAVACLIIGLLAVTIALNGDALQQRFLAVNSASQVRARIYADHWQAFRESPWSGYGLGSFARINGRLTSASTASDLSLIGAAHNVYLQWLEEAGAPAAALMFSTIGLVALQLARGALRRRRMRSWILAIGAVLALVLIHGASDYALQVPSMAAYVSLLLGVGYGLSSAPPGRAPRSAAPHRAP